MADVLTPEEAIRMGRGLGHLQNAILHYLQEKNAPCWAAELAQAVSARDQRDATANQRSRDVAVQRALRSLQQRGLIRCGYVDPVSHGSGGRRLMCWLPEHTAPPTRPVLHGCDVEAAVLAALRRAPTLTDRFERMASLQVPIPSRHLPRPRNGVSYRWLVGEVKRALNAPADDNRTSVAINRAVKRLDDDWQVEVVRSRYGGVVWIRLAT
jgi:hypothetical protein